MIDSQAALVVNYMADVHVLVTEDFLSARIIAYRDVALDTGHWKLKDKEETPSKNKGMKGLFKGT